MITALCTDNHYYKDSKHNERNIMGTEDRGFASMDESKQRDIASKGGKASSTASSKTKLSEAGKKGAAAQPTAAKAKGGHNSHINR
jgi:general stress protein YciG